MDGVFAHDQTGTKEKEHFLCQKLIPYYLLIFKDFLLQVGVRGSQILNRLSLTLTFLDTEAMGSSGAIPQD
jgi:hypothetical protein